MDALTCIETRRTAPALTGPEPTAGELRTILRAATRAPDHKLLRPWRFVVVRGESRQRLGEAFVASVQATSKEPLTEEYLGKVRYKTSRAPLIIVIIASPSQESKLAVWEQHASAAAAAQNMCLAAHALGLGAGWKSAPFCDDPPVRALLAMKPWETCLGWIEMGQRPTEPKPKDRRDVALSDVVSELGPRGLEAFAAP